MGKGVRGIESIIVCNHYMIIFIGRSSLHDRINSINIAVPAEVYCIQIRKVEEQQKTITPPFCLLFTNDSFIVKKYEKIVKKFSNETWSDFQFLYNEKKLAGNHTIQCIYYDSIHQISLQNVSTKRVDHWFKRVLYDYEDRIPVLVRARNLKEIVATDNVYIIIGVPGNNGKKQVEDILAYFHRFHHDFNVKAFIVPPNTPMESELLEKNVIDSIPIVQVYYQENYRQLKLIREFSSIFEISKEASMIHLLNHKYNALVMTQEKLKNMISYPQSITSSMLIFVYVIQQTNSYVPLSAFYRAYEHFKEHHDGIVDFYTLDVSQEEIAHLFALYAKNHTIKFPYILLTKKHEATIQAKSNQQITLLDIIPTSMKLEVLLTEQGILSFAPQKPFPMATEFQCSFNTTYCLMGDKQASVTRHRKRRKSYNHVNMIGNLPIITSKNWDTIFSINHDYHQKSLFKRSLQHESSHLTMIAFTKEDCSFCKYALKEFQQVAESIRHLSRVSMFLMNCTEDLLKYKQHHVSGYPAILLFRHFSSFGVNDCISSKRLSSTISVSYHGTYEHDDIMKWLSDFLPSNTHVFKTRKQSENIRYVKSFNIIGRYYTKEYTRRYLPEIFARSLIPLQCVRVLCDMFHAEGDCYMIPHGAKDEHSTSELFLSSLELRRQDNFSSVLYEFNKPMSHMFELSDGKQWNAFQEIHDKHEYEFNDNFLCENDHIKCFNMIIDFIEDHSRLPITSVTMEMFHSHKRSSHLWKRPILLALANQENITYDALFFKDLYEVAVETYDVINVAVLNIDEHAFWAQAFAPKSFFTSQDVLSEDLLVLKYPRFCMIDLHDHDHAAFFPNLYPGMPDSRQAYIKDRIPRESLIDFVKTYIYSKGTSSVEIDRY